jgi:hypothetical protein
MGGGGEFAKNLRASPFNRDLHYQIIPLIAKSLNGLNINIVVKLSHKGEETNG